jgi:hypothetical protein
VIGTFQHQIPSCKTKDGESCIWNGFS